MTDSEWLACEDSPRMMSYLLRGVDPSGLSAPVRAVSDRKLFLFACAAWRNIDFPVPRSENEDCELVEQLEEWADGGPGPEKKLARTRFIGTTRLLDAERDAAWHFCHPINVHDRPLRAALLREIFGNPCSPMKLPGQLGPMVVGLADAAYQERVEFTGELDPVRLLVLADALEESGCDDTLILTHLRSPGPHYRGCWAVDLLLRKS